MPQRTPSRRMYTRLLLFSLAGFALWALGRNRPESHGRVPETADVHGAHTNDTKNTRARERSSYSKRRLATSLTFATLFFAGAALSAGAGDTVAEMMEGTDASTAAETTTEEAPAEEASPAPEAPAEEPAAEAPAEEPAAAPAEEPTEAPAEEPAAEDGSAGEAPATGEEPADGEGDSGAEQPAEEPEEEPAAAPKDDEPSGGQGSATDEQDEAAHELPATPSEETSEGLEFESGFATIWLHRTLADPLPLAQRLSPKWATMLARTANRQDADWAEVLAVLRATGHNGREPATRARLGRLASQLAALGSKRNSWETMLAVSGRTAFADRANALVNYYHGVGLRALVTGLEAAKDSLGERVLFDGRIDLYAGGANDVATGRVDVRVLVLLRYMAEAHGQVTVSSLKSGHRFYARPGVPSAHMYGLAVDIAGLEGKSIMGNQAPGGLTERAVRNILLLPRELRPKQVISLLGLGGPSFPLKDHYDHIHVGY
jgi:outer membrane biosynthesis protein TonB